MMDKEKFETLQLVNDFYFHIGYMQGLIKRKALTDHLIECGWAQESLQIFKDLLQFADTTTLFGEKYQEEPKVK